MDIGSIVKSNSHISYLCRIYGKLETESVPVPSDYAFGTFVVLSPDTGSATCLVGVVRDTLLLNPEYGHIGPRLSTNEDLAVFSPDYLNETGILVDIAILGWMEGTQVGHSVPALAAQVGTTVQAMPHDEIYAFHRDERGRYFMGYLPQMLARNDPMAASLLLSILDRMEPIFADQGRVISVLRNNVAWRAHVVPAG